jgi:type II secretory pathway component GspD/PulD (secretin)
MYIIHKLERFLRVPVVAGICLVGLLPGAGAEELTPLLQNMQNAGAVSEAQTPPAQEHAGKRPEKKPGPDLLNTETTLIGDNRLPDMLVNEFDVTSGATLGSVLRSLAKMADVNLMFSEQVNGQESLSFKMQKPTPWNDLFDSILKVHHLSHLQDPGMIRIMTVQDMALEYELQESISRRTALSAETRLTEPMVLAVIDVKYAKAETLVLVLKEILKQAADYTGGGQTSGSGRGSVSADLANNTVIVNAIQSDVDKLVDLDTHLNPSERAVVSLS